MTNIMAAVVEQLHVMSSHPAHSQLPGRPRRRSPRPYTKQLASSSRIVPAVAMPTGPMPEDPWYSEYEGESAVPLIGEAILEYKKEHSHRTKMTVYQSTL